MAPPDTAPAWEADPALSAASTATPTATRPPRAWRLPERSVTIAVGLAALAVTAALVVGTRAEDIHTEHRLLDLRAHDAANVLDAALPSVETPLASAAALVEATNGNTAVFGSYIGPSVGPNQRFVSASLWRPGDPQPLAVVGARPALVADPAVAAAFLDRPDTPSTVHLTPKLGSPTAPRLGYSVAAPGTPAPYIVYVEVALPTGRRINIASNSAFAGLDYALFIGRAPNPAQLIQASVPTPIAGGAAVTIPFGDSAFTLVLKARHPLAGTFDARMPWFIAIGGIVLSLAFALLTDVLVRRRRDAERLAARLDHVAEDNRRLYADQRTVAETLQLALLPAELPRSTHATVAVHYVPGVEGIHVGGDWYDIIDRGRSDMLVVVGDVSGRGLQAATTMASLLYAVRAYAAEGYSPAEILTRLSALVSVEASGHFATVLCASLDLISRRITLVSAGHLPPLLIADGTPTFLDCPVGVPLGVGESTTYSPRTADLPAAASLLAFTDGLVERRGESLDVGLERLRAAAADAKHRPLSDLLADVVHTLVGDGGDDDTVLVAVRWPS